ncbi:flagellar basal body L-ring protein FlgH [Methylobacillus arboreus]|uniref:flagellar basal body L-ring protein FlgH n=1 Tax=Methylobacillus arboreus TaxID=755170 RepID=UPI001E587F4C|nr:flagellar basal body L-ring protein FlgH [Methylobacillus arboreus]MCB5189280.1 flagellar basal body L-ring protein FlgH [Methylobacillus arboreus]
MQSLIHSRPWLILGLLLLCGGCAVTPKTITQAPNTARPAVPSQAVYNSGGIYNPATYRPLLEDKRARLVGDTIVINITENTSATKSGTNSASKSGAVNAGITGLFGHNVPKASFNAASDNSYDDAAASNSRNVFTGTISATVTEVLPNGHLVVSGEKQVAFDRGTEFVRFSGVVDPMYVAAGNSVASSRVADARIEYRTNSNMDTAQVMSILTRFFLSFVPL